MPLAPVHGIPTACAVVVDMRCAGFFAHRLVNPYPQMHNPMHTMPPPSILPIPVLALARAGVGVSVTRAGVGVSATCVGVGVSATCVGVAGKV